MKILFLGDVVATPGKDAITQHLPKLRQALELDAVVVNGENSAGGRGINLESAQSLFAAGVDAITLGDHTFDQKGVEDLLAGNPRIIRPANYPKGTAGRGFCTVTTQKGQRLGVLNLQGRVFINMQIDCPFAASKAHMADYTLGKDYDALVVDIHAEATSEKAGIGHLWDGKASLVVGTHTHIPTSDTRIQPKGTAFQTDAGMCGVYQSSLGMDFEAVMARFLNPGRHMMKPASGEATLSGVLVETGPGGLATQALPFRLGGSLSQTL